MRVFKNKFLVKLIATICLILTLFNFTGAGKVYAEWGEPLVKPITNLMVSIGDAIMDVLHYAIQDQDTSIIKISGEETWEARWKKIGLVVLGILATVVVIVAASALSGLGAAVVAWLAGETFAFSMGSIGISTVLGGVAVGIAAGVAAGKAWFPDDIYLPVFSISAEEIFSNQIMSFDVNFFSPMEDEVTTALRPSNTLGKPISTINFDPDDYADYIGKGDVTSSFSLLEDAKFSTCDDGTANDIEYYERVNYPDISIEGTWNLVTWCSLYKGLSAFQYIETELNNFLSALNIKEECITDEYTITGENKYTPGNSAGYNENNTFKYTAASGSENEYSFYHFKYTIKDSAGNTVASYEEECVLKYYKNSTSDGYQYAVNTTIYQMEYEEYEVDREKSTAGQLQGVVSEWYYILRNIALLVLMLVLIYTGIRIVIGSTAGEKAKYKERLMDWLVAMCLVFIMHYIMVFAISFVEKTTDLVREIANKNINVVKIPLNETQWTNAKKLDFSKFGVDGEFENGNDGIFQEMEKGSGEDQSESGVAIIWQTDLAGLFRLQSQFENEGTAKWAGYSFCYVVLVLFTLFFAFTYIRRVIYMAFLTIIAPLVAMTYPIDKITDGKAQAFDAWLKEYIFNLLIQPLHLLLYSILVTSAFELASKNPIYALVAIGFMMPAEKLMRRFFGFERAKTPGLLGGAAGAAIAMTGLQNLLKPKPHGGNGKSDGSEKGSDAGNVKFSNKNTLNAQDGISGRTVEDGGAASDNGTSVPKTANKPEYDPRLTEEQRDDMIAEGIEPGDPEYNNLLRQYGITPSEEDSDTISDDSAAAPDDNAVVPDDSIRHLQPVEAKTVTLQTPQQANKKNKHKRSIKGAVGAVMLGVGKQAVAGILRGVHPLKLAGKIAIGASAATAGLLIGTASGDATKAFQYTTTGAMAGSALADSLSKGSKLDMDSIGRDMQMAYYGPEYKEKVIEKQKKKFQTSSENINYLRQTMGVTNAEARRILKTTGGDCFDNGITDIKDVATIHQLTHDKDSRMSFTKAAAARTYAKKRLGGADVAQMTDDTVREYKKRWAKEFKDRYKITQTEADDLSEKAFDAAIRFNKTYSDLTKM